MNIVKIDDEIVGPETANSDSQMVSTETCACRNVLVQKGKREVPAIEHCALHGGGVTYSCGCWQGRLELRIDRGDHGGLQQIVHVACKDHGGKVMWPCGCWEGLPVTSGNFTGIQFSYCNRHF